MKCDRVLSSLATGSAVARWLARRHVARCLRCAEVQIQLQEITRELADAPPLTAAQRALWTAASTEPTASRARRVWVYRAGLAGRRGAPRRDRTEALGYPSPAWRRGPAKCREDCSAAAGAGLGPAVRAWQARRRDARQG